MAVGGENVAYGVIGVDVGFLAGGGQELALAVISVGDDLAIRGGIGQDIAHGIIGIGINLIRGQVVGDRADLPGGLGAGNVPVGVGLGVDAAGSRINPFYTIRFGSSFRYCINPAIANKIRRAIHSASGFFVGNTMTV